MLNDFRGKISVGLIALMFAGGCASSRTKADHDELVSMRNQLGEMRGLFTALTSRVEAVEGKLNTLATTTAPADRVATSNASPVQAHPGQGVGVTPIDIPSAGDPDGAFINDDAVQDFRRGMIRFRAGQYPEAAASFSSFLEKYPDHPLAGNAAYLIGRSYFKQANFKQAVEEYQRVLTTYDRSGHVAATLRDLADAEDQLKQTDDAARHRQLLASLFPHSPESQASREEMPVSAAPAPANNNRLDSPPATAPGGMTSEAPTAPIAAPTEPAVVPMKDVAPTPNGAAKAAPAHLDDVPAIPPLKE